jgi:hypothetical protein
MKLKTRAGSILDRRADVESRLGEAELIRSAGDDTPERQLEKSGLVWDRVDSSSSVYFDGPEPIGLVTSDGAVYKIGEPALRPAEPDAAEEAREGSLDAVISKATALFDQVRDAYDGYVPGEDDARAHAKLGKTMDHLRKAIGSLKGLS